MASKKKENALARRIKYLRKEIRKQVEEELLQKYSAFQKQGKYPWQGLWLRPQEIEALQKKLKRRDKIAFGEIIILFLVSAAFCYGFYRLLFFLLPQ